MSAIASHSSAGPRQANRGRRRREEPRSRARRAARRRRRTRVVDVDDQRRRRVSCASAWLDHGGEFAVGDQHLRLAMLEDEGDGVGVEPDVERVQHRARHRHAEMRLEQLRRCWAPSPRRCRPCRCRAGERVGEPAAARDKGRGLAVAPLAMDHREPVGIDRGRRGPGSQRRQRHVIRRARAPYAVNRRCSSSPIAPLRRGTDPRTLKLGRNESRHASNCGRLTLATSHCHPRCWAGSPRGALRIDIVLDVICPWCFIGKRRLEQALACGPKSRPRSLAPVSAQSGCRPTAWPDRISRSVKFGGSHHAGRNTRRSPRPGQRFAFPSPSSASPHAQHREPIASSAAPPGGLAEALVERLFRLFPRGRRYRRPQRTGRDRRRSRGRRAAASASSTQRACGRNHGRGPRHQAPGINAVPCFVFAGHYAISGAQEPEFFLPVFDLVHNGAPAPAL